MDGEFKESVQNETKSMEDSGKVKGKVDAKACQEESYVLSVAEILQKIGACMKQKQREEGLALCNKGLSVHSGNVKLLERKSKILRQLFRFQDALVVVEEWLRKDPENDSARKEYDTIKFILNAVKEQDSDEDSSQSKEDYSRDEKRTERAQNNLSSPKQKSNGDSVKDSNMPSSEKEPKSETNVDIKKISPSNSKRDDIMPDITASLKDINLSLKEDLGSFLQRERLLPDDSHQWEHRAPPRGLASDEYGLCKRYLETGRCTFGEKCTQAHSEAELEEWNHRYAVRKQQLQQSLDARAHGGTYIEQLFEKLMCQEQPKMMLVENLDFVKVHVNSDLKISMNTKKCTNAWTFTLTSKLCLHCVALMTDTNRSYFHISSISVGPRKTQKYQNLENLCQEWINQDTHGKGQGEYVYRVKVVFKTDIYGTFRQSIVFDFGFEAILMREVQVESAPATDPEKIRKEITLTEAHRWNERTVTLVPFEPRPVSHNESERALMTKYTLPRPDKLCHPETVMHALSKDNYRLWMHEMLYIEEVAQLGYISRFNVTTSLQLVNRFLLMPSSLSTAKYAQGGELFARMKLEDDLSEDSMAGRLILQSSHVAWVAEGKKERPEKVYEAVIEDKGKNFIFMRLSKTCVEDLGLSCDQDFCAQIQFQLNRLPMCEMHSAVDRLPTLNIVFPDLENMPSKLELGTKNDLQPEDGKKRLNEKQKDAVRTILASKDLKLPPLLIVGPFGTGKTFTMARAAKEVLKQEGTRILICTHSNSAADLYIKEFLHDYISDDDHSEARPLRIMYKFRWIQTVPEVVLQYTLLERSGPNAGTFRLPTVEDVLAHRVVITTLSSARYVVDLDLPPDIFSHIFIDEAAQSLESETLIPLSVASEKTRIVFAGDHMQMSPEVYADFTRQQGFHTSLLERLHELYPQECVYKVMLCENYRSHSAIIDFTSELFYDNKLISSGNIVPHEQFYPLTFYAAKGEEVQHENSTGFYNLSEIYEIVERVDELKKKWPEAWGPFDDNGISIVAPYSDQVARIRGELRKRKLFNVKVERVLNVQGKQYRVIMLSITRTRLTCRSDPNVEEYLDFGFLSNIKLLNTAITRAQSLVVVVGDPVSVCLVGKCRKIWEYFLEICHFNNSLHGISWVPLREQLDRAELTKSFVLNPLAPEFVPSRHIQGVSMAAQSDQGPGFHASPTHMTSNVGYHGSSAPHGQALPQMYPPMVHQPMYLPYNPGVVPMYYPQNYGRGFVPNKLMMGKFLPPFQRGGSVGRDNLSRTVEMPGPRGVRHQRGGNRHNMYYSSHPRMPFQPPLQHPYAPLIPPHHPFAPGGYFYPVPDDPRAMAYSTAHPGVHPYLNPAAAAFPHPPLRPPIGGYGSVGHAFYHPLHHPFPHPQVSLSHQTPFWGSRLPHDARGNQERSDTADSSGSTRHTDSPSSGIELLPNVKHAPLHLLNKPDEVSEPSATGSKSPPDIITQGSHRSLSQRPYSPANYPKDANTSSDSRQSYSPSMIIREKAASGDDSRSSYSPASIPIEIRRSSADDALTGDDKSRSVSPPCIVGSSPSSLDGLSQESAKMRGGSNLNTRRHGPSLKLNTRTGFSRQYSDDIPTPTVITNMMQMIDDNIDENFQDELEASSPYTSSERKPSLRLKMTVAQRLQHRQTSEVGSENSSSPTPPSSDNSQPSYANVLSRSPDLRQPMSAEEATQLETQTPRTPKGFITPGTDVEVDPLGILKSLNIGNIPQ